MSGSFRRDGATVQLIIYVKKGDSVYRIRWRDGEKTPRRESVTDPHEYSDAFSDFQQMGKATTSLRAALEELQRRDPTLLPVGVVPRSRGKSAFAEFTVLDNGAVKRLSVSLQ